jgi:8-oxo-dGTP pyrophosphatase MutT (NUDIX family)
MGAGILPIAFHNGKLFFLFGKENKYNDTPGWADFGGGQDLGETVFECAIREGTEELTGFLGSEAELKTMFRKNPKFTLKHGNYTTFFLLIDYNESLPFYYNNNQRFLQKKLSPSLIKNSKIFEKQEIQWFSLDDMKKKRKQFRYFYRDMVDLILEEKNSILSFFN